MALEAATAYEVSSDFRTDASYLTSMLADDLPTVGILTARDRWDDEAIVCISLIASGLPRFDQVADFVRTFVIGRIITSVIRFAVYGVGERVLLASRILAASAMIGALIRLVTNRNEMSQLVNGFVRAATICFGWAIGHINNALVVKSLFEYGAITRPAPGNSDWTGGL
ncbi:hypothetical protein GJ496_007815 [Pomphorhynchus laevis]|nr:hypothetical protein GJ496_007815 [Pomphorhynchus laevis]